MNRTLRLILTSRKVWIALTAIASHVVIVAGGDPVKWDPLIKSIDTLAIVVIGAMALEDAAEKRAGNQPENDGPIKNNPQPPEEFVITKMPTGPAPLTSSSSLISPPPAAAIVLLIGGIFAMFFLGGCAASTPTARWAQARDTLSTAEKNIVTMHRAGLISDADFVALDPSVQAARKSLTAAQQQLDNTGGAATPAFDFYLSLTDSILDQLTGGKLNKVKSATPARAPARAPATNPSTSMKGVQNDGTGGNPGGDSSGTGRDCLSRAPSGPGQAGWQIHRRAA